MHATRRELLAGAGALCGATCLALRPSQATPDTLRAAIKKVVGNAEVGKGKISMDIPALVENGNVVPLSIAVDSPMTPANYVKAIHIFNEKNPQPNIGNFYLGPHSGRAQVSTRIRLADSQKIVAIARLSDGSFWSTSVEVVVALAACTEEVI